MTLWASVLTGAAIALFHYRAHIILHYKAWRMGARPLAEFGADLDRHAIHVFRGCTDERESWEDCKAHIARFLPCAPGDVVVVVRDPVNGRIERAHTRRHAVVFSTMLGTVVAGGHDPGRWQPVIVRAAGRRQDMGALRAGMTGHAIGTIDALDCERLRALIAMHR